MTELFFDTNITPNTNEEFVLALTNIYSSKYREAFEDIYFTEVFEDCIYKLLLQNANYSLIESFQKDNIYNFAGLSEDKRNIILNSVLGMSFDVEYEDGVVIKVVTFKNFFKGLLRRVCEEVEMMQVVERNISMNDSLTYAYVFNDSINNNESYTKFLNSPDFKKAFKNQVECIKVERLLQELKYAVNTYTRNLKNAMVQEHNNRLLHDVKKEDLTESMKRIFANSV